MLLMALVCGILSDCGLPIISEMGAAVGGGMIIFLPRDSRPC